MGQDPDLSFPPGGPPTNGMTMLEIVSGIVFGFDASIPVPAPGDEGPLHALEQAILPYLSMSPCGVSFSGGCDSSAVLAVATVAARKHRLPDPIPVTLRFPGVAGTDEASYQESVIRHLEIDDWVRIEPGDSLDVLGEISTAVTRKHGMLYPGNVHFVVPMAKAVAGGALLTGLGGDEMLGGHRHHALVEAMTGRRRPSRRLGRALIKRYPLRRRTRNQARQNLEAVLPWLTASARSMVVEKVLDTTFDDLVFAKQQLMRRTFRMRYLRQATQDIACVAAEARVSVAHPLLDPEFVAGVAHEGGRAGRASRMDHMTHLFGELLPQDVIERESKAAFDDIFWTEIARKRTDGLPVELLSDYVDEAALRKLWRSNELKGNTFLLAKYLEIMRDEP